MEAFITLASDESVCVAFQKNDNICALYIYVKKLFLYSLASYCFLSLSLYLLDMEKFPVRMKDNDLLVTELFQDPFKEEVTALSIFMPPNCCEGLVREYVEGGREGEGRGGREVNWNFLQGSCYYYY